LARAVCELIDRNQLVLVWWRHAMTTRCLPVAIFLSEVDVVSIGGAIVDEGCLRDKFCLSEGKMVYKIIEYNI